MIRSRSIKTVKHGVRQLDPITLLVIPSIALDIVLAIAIMRGRTVGGLTFCRIGRFGFSFYLASKE